MKQNQNENKDPDLRKVKQDYVDQKRSLPYISDGSNRLVENGFKLSENNNYETELLQSERIATGEGNAKE